MGFVIPKRTSMCIDSYVINRFKTIVEVFLIIFLINVEIFVWDLSSSLIIRFMNRIYYGTAYDFLDDPGY